MKILLKSLAGFICLVCLVCTLVALDGDNKSPKELVREWNTANNTKNLDALAKLYDSRVRYYQFLCSSDECIAMKALYFREHPEAEQIIEGRLFADVLRTDLVRINFTRTLKYGGTKKRLPAYLIFIRRKNSWKIYAESDLYTDRRLASAGDIPPDALKGDFNGDEETDYAWVESSPDADGTSRIRFSGPIAPLVLKTAVKGEPVNRGDLDGDGADEIEVQLDDETAASIIFVTYTYKHGEWIEMNSAGTDNDK
jgi:hypothetical protein